MNRITQLTLLFFAVFSTVLSAQTTFSEVTYQMSERTTKVGQTAATLRFKDNVAYIYGAGGECNSFIDFNRKLLVDMIDYNGKKYRTQQPFADLDKPTFVEGTEKILGYKCKKAVYSSFSNSIEVWYTTKTKIKGSPYKSFVPENSLVLKVKRNGNIVYVASKIIKKKKSDIKLVYPYEESTQISLAEFRELQIKKRYVAIQVFDKEQINFDPSLKIPSELKPGVVYRLSNGGVILKKVKIPKIGGYGVSVYAKITNWSNGDAYDRTGSLFTISTNKEKSIVDALKNGLDVLPVVKDNNGDEYQGIVSTDDYDVPIELMRFFTSFGVSHFNDLRPINNYNWADSVVYKQEITKLIPNDQDEIWVGMFIGNYDKGGHKVSLELDFYPSSRFAIEGKKYINPIFNTLNVMEMSGQNYGRIFKDDTLRTTFDVPANIKDLTMLYTSTGHGGWSNGDEFVPKLNQIFIDGKLVYSVVPWRTDCGTYRMNNPASGNFSNGESSSDLSRSNWCPAMLTPPYLIPLKDLKPGKHTIEVVIDMGEPEGNSSSSWNVSGILTGVEVE